jgi:hypothetical protein
MSELQMLICYDVNLPMYVSCMFVKLLGIVGK